MKARFFLESMVVLSMVLGVFIRRYKWGYWGGPGGVTERCGTEGGTAGDTGSVLLAVILGVVLWVVLGVVQWLVWGLVLWMLIRVAL